MMMSEKVDGYVGICRGCFEPIKQGEPLNFVLVDGERRLMCDECAGVVDDDDDA
jgi:hypothetical protein